jgi:hypothetical protein
MLEIRVAQQGQPPQNAPAEVSTLKRPVIDKSSFPILQPNPMPAIQSWRL